MCDPEEICEECPEWIFTLADLLMCMMGLFVILWVLKPDATDSPEEAVMEEVRQAETIRDIQVAFGAELDENNHAQHRLDELLRKLDQIQRNGEGEKGNAVTAPQGADGTDREVTRVREGELAGIGGKVNFEAGQDTLDPEQLIALQQIASKVRGHRNIVLVKGHASADDVAGDAADGQMSAAETRRAAMAISLRRAQFVCDYLVDQGISPDILRVQGCGTFEPIRLRAYTETDRRTNRRVEVEATDQLVNAFSDAPEVAPRTSAP